MFLKYLNKYIKTSYVDLKKNNFSINYFVNECSWLINKAYVTAVV